jgi:sulfur carrier protein ThiS
MNIYKLKYNDEAEAIADLTAKGVITEDGYAPETVAVVYIGQIVDHPSTLTEEGEIDTEATFIEGYHVDIMTSATIEFDNEEHPTNPVHTFA